MEIVQVLIFMVIIAIAIVQQITKAKKETGTPSPREVLTDMFPTIEETEEEEQTLNLQLNRKTRNCLLRRMVAK